MSTQTWSCHSQKHPRLHSQSPADSAAPAAQFTAHPPPSQDPGVTTAQQGGRQHPAPLTGSAQSWTGPSLPVGLRSTLQ